MSDPRYDTIIDRYINGLMRPDEEADFRKLLDLDDDLRRLFEAEMMIGATMLKERNVLAETDHAETYSRFLMGLAGSIPSGTAEPATSLPAPPRRRMLPLLLAGAGLLLLGILALFMLGEHGALPPARPSDSSGKETSIRRAPRDAGGSGSREEMPGSAKMNRGEQARSVERQEPRRTATPLPAGKPRDTSAVRPSAMTSPKRSAEDIPTFEDDTVRTRLKGEHPGQ